MPRGHSCSRRLWVGSDSSLESTRQILQGTGKSRHSSRQEIKVEGATVDRGGHGTPNSKNHGTDEQTCAGACQNLSECRTFREIQPERQTTEGISTRSGGAQAARPA